MRSFTILLLLTTGLSVVVKAQDAVPYRDTASYEFKLDYNFKRKPPPPRDFISYHGNEPRNDLLPYVKVILKIFTVNANDHRVQIITNQGNSVYNRRIKEPMEIVLDMGFAEDIKEKLVPHFYTINFLDREKHVHSRITIEVEQNGQFLVNDKIFGQL